MCRHFSTYQVWLVVATVLSVAGCHLLEHDAGDVTPPAKVTDLAATALAESSARLTWTAPGDDGASGTASAYDIRFATSDLTAENWELANQVANESPPRPAGQPESLLVSDLGADTTYFFALRAADEADNWSSLSNSASATTFPWEMSPEEFLNFFAKVQSDPIRDGLRFQQALHANATFYFTAQDHEGYGLPEFWTKEELAYAVSRMLEMAVTISMSITAPQLVASEPCDPEHPETLCYVYEVMVSMAVEVVETPENITYLVNGLADITLTHDELDPQQWVIYMILDRTNELGGRARARPSGPSRQGAAAVATEHVTWGAILSLFR